MPVPAAGCITTPLRNTSRYPEDGGASALSRSSASSM
jgi:hypothetical protein